MNSKQYIQQMYNKRKTCYRLLLGLQQLRNYPVLNLLWIIIGVGFVLLKKAEKVFVESINVLPIYEKVFYVSMWLLLILIPAICGLGAIYFIGCCFAIKDEADMTIVFCDKRDIKNQSPILVFKKKDKTTGVIKREFYTTIPMEQWQEKKETICDRMDIHLIGDISYGGRKKNKGNHIYFESAKGRKPKERGVLYDDIF